MRLDIEFMIFSDITTLDDALTLIRDVDHPAATNGWAPLDYK